MTRHADHQHRTRNNGGFTLVELLVVVAIIALLLSILLPSLQRARQTARAVVCGSQIRTLSSVNSMYANEYSTYYAPGWIKGPSPYNKPGWGVYWFDNSGYRDMMNIPELRDLSSVSWTGATRDGEQVTEMWPTRYLCPDATWAKADNTGDNPIDGYSNISESYGMNMSTERKIPGTNDSKHMPGHWAGSFSSAIGTRLSWIDHPSSSIEFVDARTKYNPHGGHDPHVADENHSFYWVGEDYSYSHVWGSLYAWRHPGFSANIAYYDGHVARESREEVTDEGNSQIADLWDTNMDYWTW